MERVGLESGKRPNIRTQRTKLQSALLSHVNPELIHLSKKVVSLSDKGVEGVELHFQDGTVAVADLVVGADGIRSVGSCADFGLIKSWIVELTLAFLRLLGIQHGLTMRSSSQGQPSGERCFHGRTSRNWTIGLTQRHGGMGRQHMSISHR